MSTPMRIRLTFVLLLASCSFVGTRVSAQDGWEVNLRVPSPLIEGQVYEAQLEVQPPSEIRDAYVKLSLPHAFRVVSGRTHFRGTLSAKSAFILRATFLVSATPSAPIMGRVLVYGDSRSVVFGRAKILYYRSSNGAIVLSERTQEADEDEALATQTARLAGARDDVISLLQQRQKTLAQRAVRRETLGGGRYPEGFQGVEPLPENAPITGLLEGRTVRAYQFLGHRGDHIWITAESEDLDVRLLLLRSDGALVAEDDDGAGGLNARIPAGGVFELSSDDTYTIVVSSTHSSGSGSFRLKVDNFTRLQPPAGSVLPPADGARPREANRQSAADTTLIGKIVYNSPAGPAPVRFALVKLFADVPLAVDPELAISQTDVNGEISLRVPQANLRDTLYVQAFTGDAGSKIASVRDPLLGLDLFHSAESYHFTLPAATTATFGTWNVAATGQNGPFLVLDAAVEGYLIASQLLDLVPPLVKVNFPVRNILSLIPKPGDKDAHYEPSTLEITLAELYANSPDVVLHEYGHFIAHIARILGPAGGDHSIPFYQRVDPIIAWNEGWATFFAVAGQNARGKSSKISFVSYHPDNTQNYSLEDGHNPAMIADTAKGDDNEGSVQFILWDLYDNRQDTLPLARSVDAVSLGMRRIFDVARSGAVLYTTSGSTARFGIAHLETFYAGLFQQSAFSAGDMAAVQALFVDQRIRWETPPQPPTGLRFRFVGTGLQLQWEPGSTNSSAYTVQQTLPGQSAFTTVSTTTTAVYPISNIVTGTTYRVYAWSVNSGRFSAPFASAFSQEITYTVGPPSGPMIALGNAQLAFAFVIGGLVPAAQTVSVANAGGGTLSWTATSTAGWLRVSPGSGTAPSSVAVSVDPAGLGVGLFNGGITVSSPGIAPQAIAVTLRVAAPVPSISAIVNAASFRPGMVPGGLATLFGKSLSLITGTEFPGGATWYRGISVTVEGRQVPLLAVSNVGGQEQINFQVPFELGVPATVRVEVNNNGSATAIGNVPLLRVQPGIFEWLPQGSTTRYAAAVKLDGSVASPANRVSRGDIVSLFLTGMGPVLPVLQTGQPGPGSSPAVTYLQPTVRIGGLGAQVLFSGYAPGFLGLYQINVLIPDAAPTGAVSLDVAVEGVFSQSSQIPLQ